jgi:ribonucleoside-diphosphate reductase alpha chain
MREGVKLLTIKKRNNSLEVFESEKIITAINKAFFSVNEEPKAKEIEEIAERIKDIALENSNQGTVLSVEDIQDLVEVELIDLHYHSVLKSYILYRNKRQHLRHIINDYERLGYSEEVLQILGDINANYDESGYNLEHLYHKTLSFHKPNLSEEKKLDILIKASLELTSKEFPEWEYISARFLNVKIKKEILKNIGHLENRSFYGKLKYYTKEKLYGEYILENYNESEINELESYLDNTRDKLLTYSALNLLYKRYLAKTFNNEVIETTQEMFMGIAMHLGIPEKHNRLGFVKKLYDILSKLKVTMATPTMSNSRKPHHQLSSCFIDAVDDSLSGIYKSINNFAQVSKSGGGMGLYFGKVRANGSDIRDFKGVAGGVIRWIKLANDTAIAVDQLGVRQGSVAVYLDVWHKDILEFLQLKTNNGDDRQKAHDVFPAICYPDLFWKLAKEDINATWYMMCPHEILKVKGYALEDYYGKEWEEKYYDCVNDDRIEKREVLVKDLVRLIIKSAVETGTPFTFNRDAVNRANPNKHEGIIYSSNLCTEIMQNMKPITNIKTETKTINGETVVVEKSTPGDFVVCNLASLVLGNIDLKNDKELKDIIATVTRALDNVIDLNYYPVEYAKITNKKYRAIGLGVSGYHHMLVKNGLKWESEEHLEFVDKLFEKINYYTIEASNEIALEKGCYSCFKGSDWENGDYFKIRNYTSKKWLELKEKVKVNGLRNGYLLAIAPTGSTSIIAGTTAGTDPIMNKYFLEEKKGDIVPRVAPGLNSDTFWLYKAAHNIDQKWSIKAAAVRQRHLDQSQSFNIYVTNENTMREILNMYILACEKGVKTIYYFRSKSLEVAECDSCST